MTARSKRSVPLTDREDLGRDGAYCDRLSEQRCPRCGLTRPVEEFVQVPGVGQICEACDDELSEETKVLSGGTVKDVLFDSVDNKNGRFTITTEEGVTLAVWWKDGIVTARSVVRIDNEK